MKNLPYVAWMLGWAWILSAYPSHTEPTALSALVFILIWIGVGELIRERM